VESLSANLKDDIAWSGVLNDPLVKTSFNHLGAAWSPPQKKQT
jgi:hypothetical protein